MDFVVELNPHSSFKTIPKSDTIFGAICWGVAFLYGNERLETNLLKPFDKRLPPFLISSTFPFVRCADRVIRYLPIPLLPSPVHEILEFEELKRSKLLKEAHWITAGIFSDFLHGELSYEKLRDELCLLDDSDQRRYVLHDSIIVERTLINELSDKLRIHPTIVVEMLTCLYKPGDAMHNSIDRLQGTVGEGALYYNPHNYFSPDTGCYFLLKVIDEDILEILIPALRFLEDRGIGGEVSTGQGEFDLEIIPEKLYTEPESGNAVVILSLCHPLPEQLSQIMESNISCYQVERRKGMIESAFFEGKNLWKMTLLNFKEGSLLPPPKDYWGCNPIVKEAMFKVRQYGYGFPAVIKV
jgi:CRISPR-associated protein Csm4